MTEEEYQQEMQERERLINEINNVIARINALNQENANLEIELDRSIDNIQILTAACAQLDDEVVDEMGHLSGVVSQADIGVKHIFDALQELTTQFFTFKRISTASKNITQYTDEYYTKYSFYNELRRISLGYVVGLDSNIVSSETMRKKVEKAYLQNTDYWLAYCITAVMLWASDEKEAANRAVSKSLSINYFNSCLFYLLINLRFNRIDAAKEWYVNYLDHADTDNLGEEWQYLLQAYLFGVFGSDEEFQKLISDSFKNMMAQLELTTVDFAKKFTLRAIEFAKLYIHKTSHEYINLRRNSSDYDEMMDLLTTAEKNAEIAKYFDDLTQIETNAGEDLPQRIENVLYSLVNDYDDEEFKVVQNIKLNEAIVGAKGDVSAAQEKIDATFADRAKKKNFGDLLLTWAFADEGSQVDVSVKRFSISFMKNAISKGFEEFAEDYRTKEKEKYHFVIDECEVYCGENDLAEVEKQIEKHHNKDKFISTLKDKFILIAMCIALAGVLLIGISAAVYELSEIAFGILLTLGIVAGIVGAFWIWRRIVQLGKIRAERIRKAKNLAKNVLDELAAWRKAYKDADMQNADLVSVFEKY